MAKSLMLAIISILVGCGSTPDKPQAPYVHVIMLDKSPFLEEYVEGPSAWAPLGFEVSADDSGMEECGDSWYKFGMLDCQITIGIQTNPLLREKEGTDAKSDRYTRIITLDPEVMDHYPLLISVAHEAGHILLDTPKHTQGGIMGGATWWMKQVDKDLACESIRICI